MNELTVFYTIDIPINTAIHYSKRDPSWIILSLKLMSVLTPEILRVRLMHDLGIEISEVLAQFILEYPKNNNINKDVTVVFPY
jgi:hypothetical protein